MRELVLYLAQSLVPDLSRLGPFQDDFPIFAPTDPHALVAIGAWAVLISIAIVVRRRVPLVSFALGWFLIGHLISSGRSNVVYLRDDR